MGQGWHDIGQDIADGGGLRVSPFSGVCIVMGRCRLHAFFKPLDAVDKADLQLVHDQFDRVKILLAGKAPGKIMSGIEGSVKTAAYGTGK